MGENSKIAWCHHTFNAWRGCDKVSAGCDNCYAESMSHRNPKVLGEWGPEGQRAMASEDYWQLPLKWERKARAVGERHRVFCMSLGDIWEDRPELIASRGRLLLTIEATPHLDWLLLTKRPEGVEDRLQEVVQQTHDGGDLIASHWIDGDAPANVWLGVSAENQETANERLSHLLRIRATIHFVSAEPLLGPLDLTRILCRGGWMDVLRGDRWAASTDSRPAEIIAGGYGIDWVIVGGESGHGARPADPGWIRSLRDQCQAAGAAFFFKQTGSYLARDWGLRHLKGEDPQEWPADLRIQEFPLPYAHLSQAAAASPAPLTF